MGIAVTEQCSLCDGEHQNDIEVIAKGICVHQPILPAKRLVLSAAPIKAARG